MQQKRRRQRVGAVMVEAAVARELRVLAHQPCVVLRRILRQPKVPFGAIDLKFVIELPATRWRAAGRAPAARPMRRVPSLPDGQGMLPVPIGALAVRVPVHRVPGRGVEHIVSRIGIGLLLLLHLSRILRRLLSVALKLPLELPSARARTVRTTRAAGGAHRSRSNRHVVWFESWLVAHERMLVGPAQAWLHPEAQRAGEGGDALETLERPKHVQCDIERQVEDVHRVETAPIHIEQALGGSQVAGTTAEDEPMTRLSHRGHGARDVIRLALAPVGARRVPAQVLRRVIL